MSTKSIAGCIVAFGALASAPTLGRSLSRTQHLSVNSGKAGLDYDAHRWRLTHDTDDRHYTLQHHSGSGMVMVVAESTGPSMDALPEAALTEARTIAENTRVVVKEKRVVHGVEVWCLKMEGEIKGTPVVFYGYYYSGAATTVRVVTFVEKEAFKSLERDFNAFLAGLRITE